jgi:molecular chaperone GrpE (heat shock protein)
VIEVARKGYLVRGRDRGEDDLILRHAEVIVSTGGQRRAAG